MIGRDCSTLNGIALEEASAPLAYATRVGAYDNSSDSLNHAHADASPPT
jgi:hypothetical protein